MADAGNWDWVGMATFVTALAGAVVSISGAILSWRNGSKLHEVGKAVNGNSDRLLAEATKAARAEGQLAGLSGIHDRGPLGNVDAGPPA